MCSASKVDDGIAINACPAPNLDDLLRLHPNHVSAETNDDREDSDDDLTNKRTSHACRANRHLPEVRWDCQTQKVMAPMKRAAWIQSLIGLPLSRIAEAIMAIAHAIAQRTRVVNRFVEEVLISCLLTQVMMFGRLLSLDDMILSLESEIASQFELKTV